MRYTLPLNKWSFEIADTGYKSSITLPHTWNIEPESVEYRGKGVYRTKLEISDELAEKRAVLKLGAVYHSAKVYVNGILAGEHMGSGYTPFEFDITDKLNIGECEICVVADNTPSEASLPNLKNFDWADDGGIIRQAMLLFTDKRAIKYLHAEAKIDTVEGERCSGKLIISSALTVCEPCSAVITVYDYTTGKAVLERNITAFRTNAEIPFESLKLWSPEHPNLYRVALDIGSDMLEVRCGIRSIEVKGERILLNGEDIYLAGCEWMPGSHPDFGMAEPLYHSIKCLRQLKDAGCVFTRFHWQQDSSLYDWCDENGLLVQEEIPYWGYPKAATPLQLEIAKRQADEMLLYHKNHPSIICWGVGNELQGANADTIAYVCEMVNYFKQRDSFRLVNYVSNTLAHVGNANLDEATRYGDIAMWNDYLGLWEHTDNLKAHAKRACAKCAGMPLVISEFGLCEPRFTGGDPERSKILESRLCLYAEISNVRGHVWFSLNDYRTHIGEEGEGVLKRRTHGSSDIYGNEKPSYYLLKKLQTT